MSTPPTVPPDIAQSVSPDFQGWWLHFFGALFDNAPAVLEGNKDAFAGVVAEVAAWLLELALELSSEIGRRAAQGVDQFEAEAGPEILEMAAVALSDYFNVPVSPQQISRGRSTQARLNFAEQLGRFVLESMFGAFQVPQGLTPDAGRQNAERILGYNISTALEGWVGKVVSQVPLARLIPNWADLDTVMTQNLGLGRVNRRVFGPLLKILVADPFTWDLNRRFTPALMNETELVRAHNRKLIDQATYFEKMSFHGWSTADATKILQMRSRLPEKEDLAKMLELGTISRERAVAIYEGLGFTAAGAEAMTQVTEEDRIRSINNAAESIARDMFRDREIEEGELKSALRSAGRTDSEIEALVAVALLERARPRRLPRGIIEEGFRKGLIPLGRLREYYAAEGFSLDDQVLLEELAVEDRVAQEERDRRAQEKATTTEFRSVPRGQIERAYIEGLIPASRLREWYASREYSPEDQALLFDLAARRKTEHDRKLEEALAKAQEPDFRKLPRSEIEEAFVRGVISEGRLAQWYEAQDFRPDEIPILLSNARAAKQRLEERLADQLERANRPDFRELPRSVMELAFVRDLVDEARLVEWYRLQGFRDAEIPILLEIVREKRRKRLEKEAEAATKPTA